VLTPPDGLYDEFAARFPYEETEDQQTAIDAVMADLAAGRPMDRLICGDVGFGKTEVALRAAFVAAMAGKQVAVTVPTTLLARQHTQDVHRTLRRPAGQDRPGVAAGRRKELRRSRPASPTAASTSSSAPMRCSARPSSSAISAS
jgi:RecG-like helicase